VETSVLVRYFVQDDPVMGAAAARVVDGAQEIVFSGIALLFSLARAHSVPLDELVGVVATGDPRIRPQPIVRHGMTLLPLSRRSDGPQAYK
jgi:hypothetical protein